MSADNPAIDPSIRRNLIVSLVFGPFRTAVPAVLGIVLYPLLLAAGGLELVGVWAFLNLIIGYAAVANLGLHRPISRGIAAGDIDEQSLRPQFGRCLTFYGIVTVIFIAAIVLVSDRLTAAMDLPHHPHYAWIFGIVMFAGCITMFEKIYAGVLVGDHRMYIVQMAQTIGAIIQFAVIWTMLALDMPIYGLAIGILTTRLSILLMLCVAINRFIPTWLIFKPVVSGFFDVFRKIYQARGFAFLDFGNVLRVPLLKFLIGASAGPAALGVFELAERIPGLIRQIFGIGLMAMFPTVAALASPEKRPQLNNVIRLSMAVVVLVIVTALASYLLLAQPILSLWIQGTADAVVTTTLILTFWWIATAFNIPVFWSAQALGGEGALAGIVWLHAGLILAAFQFNIGSGFDENIAAWIVFVTGTLIQIPIFVMAEWRWKLLSGAFGDWRYSLMFPVAVAIVAAGYYFRVETSDPLADWREVGTAIAMFAGVWLAGLLIITLGRPIKWTRQILGVKRQAGQ